MAKYNFSVRYAGSSLDDGRMPIKDLAPALLSISGAFQEIHSLVYPNEQPISVDIQATAKGSFLLELILANGKDLFEQVVDFFSSKETEAALNLVQLVGLLVTAIDLIKQGIKSEEKTEKGEIKLTFKDGTSMTVPEEAAKVIKSVEVREQIKTFVSPLKTDGIDRIEITSEKTETVSIVKNEANNFELPPMKEEEYEPVISVIYLQLLSVAFNNGKWRVSDGNNKFHVSIEDEDFKQSMNNKTFNENDRLKVRLRTEQRVNSKGGLDTDYIIEKVLEHIKGAIQLDLGLDDEDDE